MSFYLQNEVALESVRVASDPNIESIDPILRGCLFPHEQPENYTMKAHQKYTQVSNVVEHLQDNFGLKFKTYVCMVSIRHLVSWNATSRRTSQ